MPHVEKGSIILEMKAAGKDAALRELAALAAVQCGRFTEEAAYRALLEREALGSTGMGNGVAIPHGKVEGLDQTLLCVGRSKTGIAFDALDNNPVHSFVLLLAPAKQGSHYLQALAALSLLLKSRDFRQKLHSCSTVEDIMALFMPLSKIDIEPIC